MAGISSKALKPGYPENKKRFNGIEHNTDFDLNMYDAFYRNLDPQIGRFWQIDPKPYDGESPYIAMKNNPVLYSDPFGDTVRYKNSSELQAGIKLIEKKLGGMYKVKLVKVKDANGYTNQATLVKTKTFDSKKLTSEQKNFVTEFNKAASDKAIVRQEFVNKDADTDIGNWKTGKVDVSDLNAFDAQKGGPTTLSTYAHELKEHLVKAQKGLLPGDEGPLDIDGIPIEYRAAHQEGINTENFVSGTTRNPLTEVFTDNKGNKIQVQIIQTKDGGLRVTKKTIK